MSQDTRLNDGKGLQIATEADFGITRDGELDPVEQRIPGTEMAIKCKPVHSHAREEDYAEVFDQPDADAEIVAELFREFIVEGPGHDATADWVNYEAPYGLVPALIQALKNSSGEDFFLAAQEQQADETRRTLNNLDMMDEERVMALLNAERNDSDDEQQSNSNSTK